MNNDDRITELEQLAYHDSLTGLFNRNWLYEHLYCNKFKYVYFFDINDLRKINDIKGHIAGDNYIKKIIRNIVLNENEILIRYAGDEFILLSNRMDALKTNRLFSVGMSMFRTSLLRAIMLADKNMLINKHKQKYEKSTSFR